MARTKQTARISGSAAAGPPPPPPPLLPAPLAADEKALDPAMLKAKLQRDFDQSMAQAKAQWEEEKRIRNAELEFKLAQQHEAMVAQWQAAQGMQAAPLSASQNSEEEKMSDESVVAASSAAASLAAPSCTAMTEASRWSHIDARHIPFPSHWPATQEHHVALGNVEAGSEDWVRIETMMKTSGLPNAALLSVQRVFNRPLWARYYVARRGVMQKLGNEAYNTPASMGNEKLMFHGTRGTAPHLIYAAADGFDVRCSAHGMLGPGAYFSTSASYSGTSYAHSLNPGSVRSSYQPYQPPGTVTKKAVTIPPLFTTVVNAKTGVTSLRATKPPASSFQMFLARVCLGTEYDSRKNGHGGYSNGRPPLRPFHCRSCTKLVDLDSINLKTLKASLVAVASGSPVGSVATVEVIDEEDEAAEETETKAGARGTSTKRKRSKANDWAPKKRRAKSTVRKATAPSLSLAVDSSSDAVRSPPSTPKASSASASCPPSPSLSFEQQPVPCPHCKASLGTRAAVLAHPYRYDSVTADHMSTVYESDRAYPEFLLTFTNKQ